MKYIPDEKEIEKMLEDSTPNQISPRLDQRLANAPWTRRAVARQRVFGTTLFVMMVMALFIGITPQGRALAQSLTQFFTRTESDTFYMEPSVLTFEDTTPFHAECGMAMTPRCSVEQVHSKVDFEIKELGMLPPDLYFIGATGGPDFIELKYGYPERLDGNLNVIIEAIGRPSTVGTGITAPSANIEPVRIGDLPAEYTNGRLFQDDEGNVTWQPAYPMQTLRWADGGSTYTLFYYSPTYPLTQEDLVKLAESMTLNP
jgi:hypothetical protein